MKEFFKKLLSYCVIGLLALFLTGSVGAQEKLNLYFFYSPDCPHCAKEKIFLDKLGEKYPQLNIVRLDTSQYQARLIWQEIGEKLDINIGGTPLTVVGGQDFLGYLNDQTTGAQIEKAVQKAFETGCVDILSVELEKQGECPKPEEKQTMPEKIEVPVFGEINIKNLSLPILTVILGLLDGFNPCAMWTLLFLISLLLGMKDRKRMWILGIAFVFVSAFVYFLFMAAWLNFFLFIGLIFWVRLLIGLFALGAGFYNLYDWWQNKGGGCNVINNEKRKKTFEKIKSIAQQKNFFLALAGIVILALAVNLVELVCSAGLPAIYTQVLSLSSLKTWQYYSYLALYIFFFMLDDLFVFFVAMVTLKAVGIENKYARFSRLFGGILITILGLLLLFKPEWLMFG